MIFNILIYVASIVCANYTATWFLPISTFAWVSVGTLIFGITFTQRDRIHSLGRKKVYLIIILTAIINALFSFIWEIPTRILIASFCSIIISEITDTEVYQTFINRHWFSRVARSNAVSIPLDSAFFNLLAFYNVYSTAILLGLILGEIIVKGVVSLIYAVVIKKISNLNLFR